MSDLIFDKPFLLYGNCIVTRGYRRSTILDLHKQEYHLIPNSLADIITKHQGQTINEIKAKFCESINIIDEYFSYLRELDVIFFTDNPEKFPSIKLDYETPSLIDNAIVEYSSGTDCEYIIRLLDSLSCKAVLCSCDTELGFSDIEEIVTSFRQSGIKHLDIYIRGNFGIDKLKELFISEYRLQQVIVFNSGKNEQYVLPKGLGREIIFSDQNVDIKRYTPLNSFSISQQLFLESQHYHSYFHKKIFIGSKGEIKNVPVCKEVLGNVYENHSIKEIVNTHEFQKFWSANKDSCDICSNCEFKYMCIDNRIPQRRLDGSWYHEIECNYNPYICKTKGESGYLNLSACGITSNSEMFLIDESKFDAINE